LIICSLGKNKPSDVSPRRVIPIHTVGSGPPANHIDLDFSRCASICGKKNTFRFLKISPVDVRTGLPLTSGSSFVAGPAFGSVARMPCLGWV